MGRLNSILWTSVQHFSTKLSGMLVLVILARMISPEVFGQFALLQSIAFVLEQIIDSGLRQSLMREENLSKLKTGTVFIINLALSAGAVMFVIAVYGLTSWLKQLSLSYLLLVILGTVLGNLKVSSEVTMVRKTNFESLAKKYVFAFWLSFIFCLPVVVYVGGIEGLIARHLLFGLFSFALIFDFSLLNQNYWSYKEAKAQIRYSKNLVLGSFFERAANTFSIGYLSAQLGNSSLGLYDRSAQLSFMPASLINGIVTKVFYTHTINQSTASARIESISQQVAISFLINAFFATIVVVNVKLVVLVLLGVDWLECTRYIPFITTSLIIFPINSMINTVLNIRGKNDLILLFSSLKSIGIVIVFYYYSTNLEEIVKSLLINRFLLTILGLGLVYLSSREYYQGLLKGVLNAIISSSYYILPCFPLVYLRIQNTWILFCIHILIITTILMYRSRRENNIEKFLLKSVKIAYKEWKIGLQN